MAFLASISAAGRQSLRPTETRVRTRDGSIFLERKNSTGFASEFLIKADKPDYVTQQEISFSILKPKMYDEVRNRWVPSLVNTDDVAPGPNCQNKVTDIDETPTTTIVPPALRIITFNVWFDKQNKRARADELFRILESEGADAIFLQEVTPEFLGWLRDEPWVS